MSGDLGDFLAEGGAIVGGGAALGATLGFIVGALVHDVRPKTDPEGGPATEDASEASWDWLPWRFAA